MKTIYSSPSKDAIAMGELTLEGGKYMKVVLTNEPDVIDAVVNTIDSIDPDTLLVLHTPYGGWTTDWEWKKEHPKAGSGNHPAGYVCQYCHEPVECYASLYEGTSKLRHVRYLCGCTMLLLSPEMGPWWSEVSCYELWNGGLVPGAKRAHKQRGIK